MPIGEGEQELINQNQFSCRLTRRIPGNVPKKKPGGRSLKKEELAPRQDLHQKKHSAPGKIFNKRRLNLICSTRCLFKYRDAPEFCIVKSSSPPACIILVGHAPEACSLHHEKFHKERRNVICPQILALIKSRFELRIHGIFNLNRCPSKNSKPHTRLSAVSSVWIGSFTAMDF